MKYIEGQSRRQITLLPEAVEDYIEEENPTRVIEAYAESLDLKSLGFKISESETGRPRYNPADLLKLYMYGYFNKIRSSRKLEAETKRNLEVIWLMKKLTPDHKTISDFRRENPTALKNVFKNFVKLCIQLGLYGKELVAVDGSKFKAVNSKDRNFTRKDLAKRLAKIEEQIEAYTSALDEADKLESTAEDKKTADEIKDIIKRLEEGKAVYKKYEEELKETGETQISITDPDSRLMKMNGKYDVCYNVQTAVDAKNKMIAEFEVLNDPQDKNHLSEVTKQAAETMECQTLTAVADGGYDSVSDIVRCIQNEITPNVSGAEMEICIPTEAENETVIRTHKNGRCVYIKERNIGICPMGKILYPGSYKKSPGTAIFYNTKACKECTCKCTKTRRQKFEIRMKQEKFTKEYNDKNLYLRQVKVIPDKNILAARKAIVEHPFGIVKHAMGFRDCLLKGLEKVSGEFSLIFLCLNLKRAINILGVNNLVAAIQS